MVSWQEASSSVPLVVSVDLCTDRCPGCRCSDCGLVFGGFSKYYDADNFVSSLNGVVQVVARLPAKWQKVKPEIVKVPYKVTLEYIEEKVKPVFIEKNVVQELGEKAMKSLIEMSGSQQFIAVDLRVDMLHQLGCKQPENSRSKRCFDASHVATFLKRVGFSSSVPIYLTQSTWDQSLDVLKDTFPKD
ncbi:hypothetical protein GOP47_0016879 [Adiantum capillus-veneris]|uniref:Uncharacterized protein n=1 Tax=Adiantum capillus-veneris TaxID=13818 RepID=A0A9D4UJA2_ADICA|nr:hypothetical protein GOP47_0016879 [Adiantum capillus-veneris]